MPPCTRREYQHINPIRSLDAVVSFGDRHRNKHAVGRLHNYQFARDTRTRSSRERKTLANQPRWACLATPARTYCCSDISSVGWPAFSVPGRTSSSCPWRIDNCATGQRHACCGKILETYYRIETSDRVYVLVFAPGTGWRGGLPIWLTRSHQDCYRWSERPHA